LSTFIISGLLAQVGSKAATAQIDKTGFMVRSPGWVAKLNCIAHRRGDHSRKHAAGTGLDAIGRREKAGSRAGLSVRMQVRVSSPC